MTLLYSTLWGESEYHHSRHPRLCSYVFTPTNGPKTIELTASGLLAFDSVCMSIGEWEDAIAEARKIEAEINKGAKP